MGDNISADSWLILRACELDLGETAVPAEPYLDSLSRHQPPVTISQSPAQPSTVAIVSTHGAMALVCALGCAGLALTILVFYPGYLTRDAAFVRNYVESWHLGDWQSPLM